MFRIFVQSLCFDKIKPYLSTSKFVCVHLLGKYSIICKYLESILISVYFCTDFDTISSTGPVYRL